MLPHCPVHGALVISTVPGKGREGLVNVAEKPGDLAGIPAETLRHGCGENLTVLVDHYMELSPSSSPLPPVLVA